MSARKHLVALLIAGATAPLSAMAGVDFVFVGGEPGYKLQGNSAPGLTRAEKLAQDRAQVAAEAAQLSGWRRAPGEAGWIYEGHRYARVNGEFVCVDGIDHGTRASFAPPADESLFRGG